MAKRSTAKRYGPEHHVNRGMQPAGIPGEPAPAPAADTTIPLVPIGLVVYGFAEEPNEQQVLLPNFFLGEFVVTASTPDSVTIEPTAPLEEQQQQAIQNRLATSWSLYELLPLDGHKVFIAEGSLPSDENFLGRVDDALVNQLLGERVRPETLQDYLRDGGRSVPSDPPLSRWTKVEFDKSEKFDVDAEDERSALDGGFFDGAGRAVDGRLQKGAEVQFNKGDQIVVKEEEANRLIDEGIAHMLDQYFLRPLNDYRYVLRHIRMRLTRLNKRIETMQFEKEVLQTAADKTQAMLVNKQGIKLKLEQDFVHFRTEKQAIEKHAELLRIRERNASGNEAATSAEHYAGTPTSNPTGRRRRKPTGRRRNPLVLCSAALPADPCLNYRQLRSSPVD